MGLGRDVLFRFVLTIYVGEFRKNSDRYHNNLLFSSICIKLSQVHIKQTIVFICNFLFWDSGFQE